MTAYLLFVWIMLHADSLYTMLIVSSLRPAIFLLLPLMVHLY